jgi:CRISPR-associated endonuclease Cas1
MVSLAALRWLEAQDAAFVLLNRIGKVCSTIGPVSSSDVKLRRAQSLAHQSGLALHIAQELIKQKLIGQERVMRRRFGDEDAADAILRVRNALVKTRTIDDVRRFEAQAALAYWAAWHDLPIAYPAADLRRVPNHWRTFGSRQSALTNSPRLAANPPNSMLNLLYGVLESEARLAISVLGMDTGIGFLHADSRTRDSLACDLMEPVRPQVDAFLLDWVQRAPLQRKWFFEQGDGHCRLTAEFACELCQTSKLWREALGPFAEWIAHTLWSTSTSRLSRTKNPATRLTQNRKREAKGIPASTPLVPAASPAISRENTLKAPKPAGIIIHDPIAQSRRAETQQRQAAALKAWKPADNPDWLGEKFYYEQVKPLLRAVQVPTIQRALSVSEPYALRIRNGQIVPHPRHWLALAHLVNVER